MRRMEVQMYKTTWQSRNRQSESCTQQIRGRKQEVFDIQRMTAGLTIGLLSVGPLHGVRVSIAVVDAVLVASVIRV